MKMNAEQFVNSISRVNSSAVRRMTANFENPPGRDPSPDLLRVSRFFTGLDDDSRLAFTDAMLIIARLCTHNFLLILDGGIAIESGSEKGSLELIYDDGTSRIRLNDPEGSSLSEIFRQQD